jgi:radical SAM protein with 4Fe4S-binding SPASM domain
MIQMESYPCPLPHHALHVTARDSFLYRTRRAKEAVDKAHFGFEEFKQWHVPPLTARYLARCDGRTTHGEIARELGEGVPHLGELLANQVAQVLVEDIGAIEMRDRPIEGPPAMKVTGGFDSFAPSHISFEITDTCNFRCDHCYVSASPEKHGRKNGAETMAMLDRLAEHGVRVVELTGGECTTHPEFKEILHHASEAFLLVGVITNGYLLGRRADLAEFVAQHANVMVQVSLDGLRDFHDRFRGMEGSFDMACEAIRRLRARGTFVRLAMSVSSDNLDHVEGVFLLARELGVNVFSVAPVTTFGRGAGLMGCPEMEFHVMHRLNEILAPYADDPLFEALRRERAGSADRHEINCGAGWRSFALNSDGRVRSCLYLVDSKKFGNLDTEDYDEIFRRKEMHMFRNAPSPGGAECQGPQPDGSERCRYLPVCTGCFAKALRVSETDYPQCPWRAKWFPGMKLALEEPEPVVRVESLVRRRPATVRGW